MIFLKEINMKNKIKQNINLNYFEEKQKGQELL
jgi:hypothetical protein